MSLIVADIGNSRMKWGCWSADGIDATVSLPSDDPAAWDAQLKKWNLPDEQWTVASVVPAARDRFVAWLRERGNPVQVIDSFRQLTIRVDVDNPASVGIDRLLNAVAATSRGAPALIVDAGSAVTVDLVDADGVFRGGAIFSGLRLMAKALNNYTAQLPLIAIGERVPPPGKSTDAAIKTGVFHAVVGGIDRLLADLDCDRAAVWFTGGDAALLAPHLRRRATVWPEMTLEGLLLTALAAKP